MTTSETPRTDSVWHGYLPTPVRDVRYEESKNLERDLSAAKECVIELKRCAKINDAETKEIIADLERLLACAKAATIEECIRLCNRRADSVREGSAVARQCAADIRALATVPPGYQCVPVEPTVEMLDSGFAVTPFAGTAYKAMLTAAKNP